MTPFAIFLPALTAALNRVWRGEGAVPRWAFFAFMTCPMVILDWRLTLPWLLVLVGYTVPPTQAMFSAVHGRPPGRRDGWAWNWMHPATTSIITVKPGGTMMGIYRIYGMVYGGLRGLYTLPGVLWVWWVSGTPIALLGVLFLGQGVVFYQAGRIARRFELPETMAVPIAEVVMGWWLGSYMLVCAG